MKFLLDQSGTADVGRVEATLDEMIKVPVERLNNTGLYFPLFAVWSCLFSHELLV
jgi:hypothetical protein